MHLAGESSRSGHNVDSLERLQAVGVIRGTPPHADRRPLVDPYRAQADLTRRARSYLHINCAHCHRKHAGGSVLSQMQYDLELDKAQLLGVSPSQGELTIDDARVIAPGDPAHSVLLYRLAKTGRGRMPRLGSYEVDSRGLALLSKWIERMDANGKLSAGEREPDRTGIPNWLRDQLDDHETIDAQQLAARLPSPADVLEIVLALDQGALPPNQQQRLAVAASAHPNPIVRDLFERFLPENQRKQRLGDRIDPQTILALEGDPERGEQVFFADGASQCQQCHMVQGRGKAVGPDLSRIGSQRSREELLRELLEPSAVIDPKYQTYLVVTVDGRALTGLLVERTAERVVLRDAEDHKAKVPTDEIEQMIVQPRSMMPDGQLRELTAQQAADLLAFLVNLRQSGERPATE